MTDCCKAETKLIYACSGAADVGEIADQVAGSCALKNLLK